MTAMPLTRRDAMFSFSCIAATAFGVEPKIEKIDLFRAADGDYELYRIPGIVVTQKGTVLAFCEARKGTANDWGIIDIMLRRSEDGGRTWTPCRKVAEVPGPHHKNSVALAQNLAKPDERTYNNPLAIAGRDGTVHFLYCLEYMRAFYMRSTDEGKTFSAPVEITAAFEGFRPGYDWKVLATGPGHGIQLRNGRLVVPVWLSTGTGANAHKPSVNSVIFSDDNGLTWKPGEIAVPDTPEYVSSSETIAAELADGRVMLNVRTTSKDNRRVLVYSRDGATGWTAPQFHKQLLEPICMASMARYSLARNGRGRNRLLFSNPDNLERVDGKAAPGVGRDRKNLTIKMSYDEAETWPVSKTLEDGWSGYSDLAVLKDGTVLCFYERGRLNDNHFRTAALTVARFNLEWLTGGKDKGK
jgi:sialidase-1